MSIKKIGKRILSMSMVTIMAVSLLTGVTSNELSKVQAATALKAPTKNGSGVVTWDCVYFGRYPQTDKTGTTKDAIKWRVLSVDGNDAFLVADCNLDAQQYHDKFEKTTWETCTLRSWLNGYGYANNSSKVDYTKGNFIDRAFSDTEQKAIKTTTVKPDAANGGNETKDKIFLLSYSDALNQEYGFSGETKTDKARERVNTAYVAAGGSISDYPGQYDVKVNGSGEKNWWWLRTPGTFTNNACYVGVAGSVSNNGYVDTGRYAICPALYLDLSKSSLWSYAGTVSSDGTSTPGEEPPKVDDAQIPVEDPDTGDSYVEDTTDESNNTVVYNGTNDKDVTEVEVPEEVVLNGVKYKVTAISDNAFKNNKKLKKVVIGDEITSIGKNAFYGCKNLKTVEIGKNVTSIGSKAFYKCTSLEKITIPSKVKKIGTSAFHGCTKLKSVKLGKNLTSIGSKAFYNCKKLPKITIPSKVNDIGKQAFGKCKALKVITIKTKKLTNSNVKSKAFKGIYSKATFKVPKSKYSAYKSLLKKKGASSKAQYKKI